MSYGDYLRYVCIRFLVVDAEEIKMIVQKKLSSHIKNEEKNIFNAFRSAVCSRKEGIQ